MRVVRDFCGRCQLVVKWFAEGNLAFREDNVELALKMLKPNITGTLDSYQPLHFSAEVAAVLSRLQPDRAKQFIDNLAQHNFTWVSPTVAYAKAIELATQLDHHLFDTFYHAVALPVP